jgi:hypothetical protein
VEGQGEEKRNHPHLGVRKVKQFCALRNVSKSTIPKREGERDSF